MSLLTLGVGGSGGVAASTLSGYAQKVTALGPIAYWPLNEASGTTANAVHPTTDLDGLYIGPTLNSTLSPIDADQAPLWDAVNDVLDIYSTAINNTLDVSSGTFSIWIKAENWVGVQSICYIYYDNANTDIPIAMFSNGSTLLLSHRIGGVSKQVKFAETSTDWMNLIATWDINANVNFYKNSTLIVSTAIDGGTPGGNIVTTRCVIGASGNGGASPWDGHLAQPVLFDAVQSAANRAALASTAGA